MLSLLRLALVWIILVIGTVLSSGCGGGSAGANTGGTAGQEAAGEVAAPPPIEALPGVLIIIGDSIMAGCAKSIDEPRADYTRTTAHLVAQQGVQVVNLSRPGNSMQHAVSQRVEGGVNFTQGGKHGTAIWVALGVGDFLLDLSTLDQYRQRYLTVLSRIDPAPARKIFCATPLIAGADYEHRVSVEGATLEDYRQVVRDIAAAGHCQLADTSTWFDAADVYDECTIPDRLHLGTAGHARYADKLLQQIRGEYSEQAEAQ